MSTLKLYFHTLKYLRFKQVFFRLFFMGRKVFRKFSGFQYPLARPLTRPVQYLPLDSPSLQASYKQPAAFEFLNLSHSFDSAQIDWNFQQYGMLWAYNLNYFDFLQQPGLSREQGLDLIHQFIQFGSQHQVAFAPYPTALRIINWVKFLSRHQISEPDILEHLFAQLKRLEDNPEYHLLGNHLLEDGFGLLFGSVFFQDQEVFSKAKQIIETELDEQILADGAHFELAPMYHCTILWRLLDSIALLKTCGQANFKSLLPNMMQKAELMLGWVQEITFSNGDIPLVNDSALDIAPNPGTLLNQAKKLGIHPTPITLKASGYRKWQFNATEILMDIGHIGPDYIPGHAHSDTLSFMVHHQQIPYLVDTGISTYEKNAQRNLERSTASHNTVQIHNWESSEVWGGFRVGRRAKPQILEESGHQITASHTGYDHRNGSHQRTFRYDKNRLLILDKVQTPKGVTAKAYFHFHPNQNPIIEDGTVLSKSGKIILEGAFKMQLEPYFYNERFNQPIPGQKLTVIFENQLETTISFKQ